VQHVKLFVVRDIPKLGREGRTGGVAPGAGARAIPAEPQRLRPDDGPRSPIIVERCRRQAEQGLLLGVVENILGVAISTTFQNSLAFAVIIVVLLVRPEGLFVRARSKKV
jgi:hypothetical protein